MSGFNQREYQTVVLGALLHDVGKMLQRGSFGSLDTGGKHPQVTSKFASAFRDFYSGFAGFDLLQTLVQRHHEDPRLGDDLICQNAPNDYKPFSFLVSRADNYSASERGEKSEDYQDFKLTPLVSAFSRIKLDKEGPEKLKYRLNPLMPENTFPGKFDVYGNGEYNEHLQKFGAEFRQLVETIKHDNFEAMFSNLLSMLDCLGLLNLLRCLQKLRKSSLKKYLKSAKSLIKNMETSLRNTENCKQ